MSLPRGGGLAGPDDGRQPLPDRGGDGLDVGSEAVIARDEYDPAVRTGRRNPERIALALDDEHGHLHPLELLEPAGRCGFRAAAGWAERESEAQDGDGAHLGGCPAGHARAERATADDERQPAQLVCGQAAGDGYPGGVELARGRR